MIDTKALREILKVEIKDAALFESAFTHRSYLNEHGENSPISNERLEFLGDAVLQLLSSEFLYNTYPLSPEGELTNFRSSIVCTPSLAAESKRLGYGRFLLLSRGEEATGGRDREYILANTFEAVLGALYIQEGLNFCRGFVERELFYKVEEIVKEEKYKDAKSKFQEIAQEKLNFTPEYILVDSWGLDHDKTFKVQVQVNGQVYGEGVGRSKQRAEMEAASNGLDKLQNR